MSLFGTLNTAVSGLTAQSDSLSNIGNNVANSQTIGYKGVGTSFYDYVVNSLAQQAESGTVVAQTAADNIAQGTVTSSTDADALAISGDGFFAVSSPSGGQTQYYTRAGDFSLDASGCLVNGAGYVLDGWPVSGGVVNRSGLAPIQITKDSYPPSSTATIALAGNLPSSGSSSVTTHATTSDFPSGMSGYTADDTSTANVYDSTGGSHQLTLSYYKLSDADDTWGLLVTDDASPANTIGSTTLAFNADGTLASVGGSTTSPASLTLNTTYPTISGNQSIALNLGAIGAGGTLTQYSAPSASVNATSDGYALGNYSGITLDASGNVIVDYDNGQTKTVARVPLVTFDDPNGLQPQNGSAFTATEAAGTARVSDAGTNGAGALSTSSVEASTVDLATEFTKLIVAQNAYTANAKVVTTTDQMLQQTLNMKQ